MENQNCILGFYEKFSNRTGHETLNSIEYGYFLRKKRSEEFFPEFLRKDGKATFSKSRGCPSDLVKKINQEKIITFYKRHEKILDVSQEIIIEYKPLRENKEMQILEAIKNTSHDSKE